jgi:UDP-N-acetylmuramate dehydrogenase
MSHHYGIRRNFPLASLTTFGVGGRAEFYCSVRTPQQLIAAVQWAKEHKKDYRVFAGGSNVVFPDGILRGLTIRMIGGRISVRKNVIVADAGVPLADVLKMAISLGLGGLETLSGIPGAVGGAVFGNAGAYGRSISESVGKVEIWDGQDRRWLPGSACRFGYRESVFKSTDWIILSVVFRLKKGEKKKLIRISRQITKTRLKKYPSGLKCPGSFFKNILVKDVSGKSLKLVDRDKIIEGKIPAGYLLEEVGAKGMGCGGIAVADYHGNLLINTGRGRAGEVRRLGGLLKGRVRKKFGIELEEEVRYF